MIFLTVGLQVPFDRLARSVDLWAAAEAQLAGLIVWRADRCTFTDTSFWSYRRDGTSNRQVAVAWLPEH